MGNRQNLCNLLKGVIVSYVVSAVFLLLLALAVWKWNVSEMVVNGVMVVIYILSTAVGGFCLGKKQKEKKFLWGILLGTLYILLLLFAAAVMSGPSGIINRETLTIAFICILSGMHGGMVA